MAVKQTLCCDRCGKDTGREPDAEGAERGAVLSVTYPTIDIEYFDLCEACAKTVRNAVGTLGKVDRSKKKAVKGKK